MRVDSNDPRPLYYQIKKYLFKKIEEGDWSTGSKIPSEPTLMKRFNVSRSTIRQAIMELAKEGYLERIQGKGTIVQEPKITPIAALTSFSENMRAAGLNPTYKTLEITETSPPLVAKNFFDLGNDDANNKILFIKRVLITNNEPIAIQNSYLLISAIKENIELFSKKYLDTHSMYNLIEEKCEIKLWEAEEKIDAALPDKQQKKLLNITRNKPLLVIERKTFSKEDQPIEYVKLIFRADKYNYKFTLSRNNYNKGGEKER